MASGSQNMTTYNARTVTGSNSAASPAGALLLSGAGRADNATGDTWIFLDSAGGTSTPWGIKHDQANNKIHIYGNNTDSVWTRMNTGDTYILGKVGIGYDPETSENLYKLYVNGSSLYTGRLYGNTGNGLEVQSLNTGNWKEGIRIYNASNNYSVLCLCNNDLSDLLSLVHNGSTHLYYLDIKNDGTYSSINIPSKHNGTMALTDGYGASGTWGINITGNAATATKATQDQNGNNIASTYLKMNTAGGIASVEGGGQYWVARICTIKITSAYINRPIVLEISGRGRQLSLVQIIFQSINGTDPGLSSFVSNYGNWFYIKKTTTSTWEVYAHYVGPWGSFCLHRITGMGANIGVTVNMNNYSTSNAMPSGATQVSYGGNVDYANSAGSVAWGNVSGKPGNYPGGCTGNAATASKITNIVSSDAASSSDTKRYVWIAYADNANGRPAYSTNFTYQTSTDTLFAGRCVDIRGTTNNTMGYTTTNPRIRFSENGIQAVYLAYTDWDSYRASKGLKVVDADNSDAGNVWFEVQGHIYSAAVHNAIWNDLGEIRKSDTHEPGYAIAPLGNRTSTRLEPGARIISDTWGFLLGNEKDTEKAPVAISGRVLAYPLHDKSYYEVGDAVCAAEGGKIDKMTRDEIKEYPDRIIGIVNEIPDYDIWEPSREGGGREPIHTNGRIWIDVR